MSAFTWPPDSPSPAGSDRPPASEPVLAAVLVPLFLASESREPSVVLTKRRADLRRHAGEISFPGGRMDAEDPDLSATALREAEEEIGLERSQVDLLGELPPTSTFVTNYVIHPFIGMIPAGVAWRLSAREVDTVLELPLETVQAARTKTTIERRGMTFETDAYVIEDQVIWGATARIIEHLLQRLSDPNPNARLTLTPAP